MKKVPLLCLLAIALLSAGIGRYRLARGFSGKRASFKEVFNLPPGRVLRQMDLGWHTLAADLLFIRANIYYGQHILTDEQLPWLDAFIESLLELDPDFKAAYLWAALVLKFQKRDSSQVPRSAITRSTEILRRGFRRFPADYRFPMRIAFNLYYELGDSEQAIPFFETAARLPDAPDWLGQKLADLYNKRGRRELARKILRHMIATTEDPELSRSLRERLETLFEPHQADHLLAQRRELVESWQRRYSFIPLDLYLTIRPRSYQERQRAGEQLPP